MKKTSKKNKQIKLEQDLVLHNYQSDYVPTVGVSGGWHNIDISLPSYVPRSELKDGKNRRYLEMPDQIMEFGDEVQKGLVLCIWKLMQEDPNSSTFSDVHEGHNLYKCVKCKGNDRQSFECKGYKYRLDELRSYNQGLRGAKK